MRLQAFALLAVLLLPMSLAGAPVEVSDPAGDEDVHYTPSHLANAFLPCHDARVDLVRLAISSGEDTLTIDVDVLDPHGTATCAGALIGAFPFAGARHTVVYGQTYPTAGSASVAFQSRDHGNDVALVYQDGNYHWVGSVTATATGYRVEVPLSSSENGGYDLRGTQARLRVSSGSGEYAAAAPWITDEAMTGLFVV